MNARRRGGEQVIDEEDEEYRGDDRALGYTSIDGVQIGEEAIHSDGNRLTQYNRIIQYGIIQ